MNILDLTYVISPDMPVYPGTEGPKFLPANSYEKDGFKETLLSMYSHTGTHMDAPAHLFAQCSTLDALPASRFCGRAVVLDVSHRTSITTEYLQARGEMLRSVDFVLFYTGWEQKWGKPDYFSAFPVMDFISILRRFDFILSKYFSRFPKTLLKFRKFAATK